MGRAEAHTIAHVRRYGHRANPISLRLCRAAIRLARLVDADTGDALLLDDWRGAVRAVAACWPGESVVDELLARRYERRAQTRERLATDTGSARPSRNLREGSPPDAPPPPHRST